MPTKKIAIAIGGNGPEYQTSLKSGTHMYRVLSQSKRYEAFLVEFKGDAWFLIDQNGEKRYRIDKNNFSVQEKNHLGFDALLNMIHGSIGEDGSLVSYLNILKVPYTCSGAFASALAHKKRECLAFLNRIGIKSAPSIYLSKRFETPLDEIEAKIGFPCIVKANSEGSSFGVLYTPNRAMLPQNIQKAFSFDSELIVEKYIKGTEVSVGGYLQGRQIHILPPTEIIPEGAFFDYEAKYLGRSQEITPARLNPRQHSHLKEAVEKIFLYLDLKGFARFDFILQGDTPFFLEVNTVPGMTPESLFPQQLQQQGIPLLEFLEMMIDQATYTNR